MWLMGDFNNWNKYEFPFKKLEFGKWELKLQPKANGECLIDHLSKIKLVIKGRNGEIFDRCAIELYSLVLIFFQI